MSSNSANSQSPQHKPTKLAELLNAFRNIVYYNLFGAKIMPMRYVINVFKGLTFAWVLFLMFYFNNYSSGMYLYLFLHGTYGMFWLLKDLFYPDSSFKQMASIGSLFVAAGLLIAYWVLPVTIAMRYGIQ